MGQYKPFAERTPEEREKHYESQRRWREKNKDKIRAYSRERMKRYRAEEPERVSAWKRAYYIRRSSGILASDRAKRLGITTEEVMEMLKRKRCDLCGKLFKKGAKREQHIDHDHKTGKVRGVLHGPCNTALGVIEKRGVDVSRFAEYLARFA